MLQSLDSEWLIGLCSVIFDIDEGQKVLETYPPGLLSPDEATNVAFHAFPDSLSAELHRRTSVRDSTFFFRTKRLSSLAQLALPASARIASHPGQQHHYDQHDSAVLYGFCFCRQRHDPALQRGAEQHSVVLLSLYPYSSLLAPLSQYAGPLYFNRGPKALQEVYSEVLEWPPPRQCSRTTVTIGGVRLLGQVPDISTLPPPLPEEGSRRLQRKPSNPNDGLLGAFFEVGLFTPLQDVLDKAWLLWEMMVLAEPIMVVAPTPGECSTAVAALIALVTPLPYCTDFRPYFTIHDCAYAELAAGAMPDNSNALPRVLGITNLYFLKALTSWRNVLSTGKRPVHASSSAGAARGSNEGPTQLDSRLQRMHHAVRRRAPQSLLSEYVSSVWHAYKPLTRPDTALLDRLVQPAANEAPAKAARICAANSAALRQHFTALTSAFLDPLLPFCTPPASEGDAPASPLASFSHAAFLDGLDRRKLAAALMERFSSQAACVQFYRRFLESPNFASWFERRRTAALAEHAHQRELAAGSTGVALSGMDDVQLIERFAALEQALDAAADPARSASAPQQVVEEHVVALKEEVMAVFEAMPRDLQHTVLSSPGRANLLHRLCHLHPKVPGHVQAQLR